MALLRIRNGAALLGLSVIAACGGQVVVDPLASATGAGGATASSSTTSGLDCTSLLNDYNAKVAAAQVCSPTASVPQCTALLNGACLCDTPVNASGLQAAKTAYDAWWNACGGPCGIDCASPVSGFCQPREDGTGVCTGAIGD